MYPNKRFSRPKPAPSNMIYGRRPIIEAIQTGKKFDRILLQKSGQGETVDDIKELVIKYNVPFQLVPTEKLNRLCRSNHQGVVGFVALVDYISLEDLLPFIYEKGETPLLLLLDGVTDVRNLGAIARTAACMGVHGIILPEKGSAQINPETIKASAGAISQMNICKVADIIQALKYLKLNGVKIIASDADSKTNIQDVDMKSPMALVLGDEGQGISAETAKHADSFVNIPMPGKKLSYNVSVAAGIMLYEIVKQRD